ncbi:MAG: carbonic anhydrase [Halanaeroarchaeum sp.]
MTDEVLEALLAGNERHVTSLPADHFDGVQDGQEPAAMCVTCSDSQVPQEGMWDVDEPGWLFTPSTIGNQVWDRVEGEREIDDSVLYPLVETGTRVAVVVGHTGCGAVTAALEAVRGDGDDAPPGLAKWIEMLVPVVETGLADDRVRPDRDADLVDQLVEFNVDR